MSKVIDESFIDGIDFSDSFIREAMDKACIESIIERAKETEDLQRGLNEQGK